MGKRVVLAMMPTLLLIISMLTLAGNVQPVKADRTLTETIYIRDDGSVDPATAPIQLEGDIYTFTGNILGSIVVQRSSIIIDGNGYILQGGNEGLSLCNINNVTIKNTNIKGFNYGVYLNSTSNSVLSENSITNNEWGIVLRLSSNVTIHGNNITANHWDGIGLYDSSNNNTIAKNKIETNISGINGGSNDNTISENNITDNRANAVSLGSNNRISRNNITNNRDGIVLGGSNIVSGNNIKSNHGFGINLESVYSSSNLIFRNNIENNENGIELTWSWSKNNIIRENNITDNLCGVFLHQCGINNFYHNNFINNTQQVYDCSWPFPEGGLGYPDPSINVWDDDYASGGNYWSNYTGADEKIGASQDQPGSDGIGDTPHIIDERNQDHYPLMTPWIPSEHEPTLDEQVGVKAGNWVKCDYTVTGWSSGTPYPEWLRVEILNVEATTATERVTMHMSDGTEQSDTVSVDVVAGGGTFDTLFGFVIPANCSTGDSIAMGGDGSTFAATIDGETTRTYAGASRTVVYASFSQFGIQLTYYWDKQTGVMVEASTTSRGITATAKVTETNMWQAQPYGLPIDPTLFYALIIVVIVIVAAVAFFMIRRRKKLPKEIEPPKS